MKGLSMSVTLIDQMGSDLTVVNAARVSFAKASKWEETPYAFDGSTSVKLFSLYDKDAKLIKYLAEHKHWSPFAHPQLMLHIKAPIFIARQLAKHQVGMVWNEISRRYVSTQPELANLDFRQASKDIKQGSLEGAFEHSDQASDIYEKYASMSISAYNSLIELGVAPEQARAVLPQGVMTEWYWTGSLYAFSRVCNLRCAKDTQKETRDIANQIKAILEQNFPVSAKYLLTN